MLRSTFFRQPVHLLAVVLLLGSAVAASANFSIVGRTPTISEEIESMAMVAIVKRVTPHTTPDFGDEDAAKIDYVVETIIKGEKLVSVGQKLTALTCRYDGPTTDEYILMSEDPLLTKLTTPWSLTPRARHYIQQLGALPKAGPERLKFFYGYLEDQDEILTRDAFDEFDQAKFATLQKLKPHLKREQLICWIGQFDDVPASRRRLYLRLLSICGGPDDASLAERIVNSTNRRERSGLDAAIDCYLTLRGAEGLPQIEEKFLRNTKADYSDTYSAIMALRFQISERQTIPRARLLAALRLMLQRVELADLVIPDLMRWEDWSAVDEVFACFQQGSADGERTWVRVPAIQYLRRCPLQSAKTYLRACERIDPHSILRANALILKNQSP